MQSNNISISWKSVIRLENNEIKEMVILDDFVQFIKQKGKM